MSKIRTISLFSLILLHTTALGEDDSRAAKVAKELANPLADLYIAPMQYNYDENIGVEDEGSRTVHNIQPVLPFSLSEDWNVLSRTVLPIIDQDDVVPGERESGIGDTLQSFFFSPVKPTDNGWLWGVGPVVSLDTASDDQLGSGQWAAGLTGLALRQHDQITYGALANHLEGFAADTGREDISSTFIQPVISIHTPTAWTYTASSESTYDWNEREWVIPVNVDVTRVIFLGKLPVSVGGGVRYWVESSDQSPEGWGLRLQATVVLPRSAF
jgi:hypothetical protein